MERWMTEDSMQGAETAEPVESADLKRQKKEQRRLEDANRPLESWERYRALNDTMDEAYELVGIANREARFAAILMGALNATVIVLVTRPEVHFAIPPRFKTWMGTLLFVYAGVAVYFFLAAIEILRPRRFRPKLSGSLEEGESHPAGVRYYEDVILRSPDEHWAAWKRVRIGQLNAELAVQIHSLALVNKSKYASVQRLYSGLRIMTVIVAAVVILIVFFVFGRGLGVRLL
jgi:cation transport ATPase